MPISDHFNQREEFYFAGLVIIATIGVPFEYLTGLEWAGTVSAFYGLFLGRRALSNRKDSSGQ
jgi:hypothetical protein